MLLGPNLGLDCFVRCITKDITKGHHVGGHDKFGEDRTKRLAQFIGVAQVPQHCMSPDVNVFVVVVLWFGRSGKHFERVQAQCLGVDRFDGPPWPLIDSAKHMLGMNFKKTLLACQALG